MGESQSFSSNIPQISLDLSEQNEEIKKIYLVIVPFEHRTAWHVGKGFLTMLPVFNVFVNFIPNIEHHGLIFKTLNGNYYYTQFPLGEFIKASKEEAIKNISYNYNKENKYFIGEEFEPTEKFTINDAIKICNESKTKYYNLITKNCQVYCQKILSQIKCKRTYIDRIYFCGGVLSGVIEKYKGGVLTFNEDEKKNIEN